MNDVLLEKLRRRAERVKVRRRVRSWEYRQRDLAAGVWFRLRRVLADAREAYAISEDEARCLLLEGYAAEPCGLEISPSKPLIFVDQERLTAIDGRTAIRVGLGEDFLGAPAVALVAFDGLHGSPHRGDDHDAGLRRLLTSAASRRQDHEHEGARPIHLLPPTVVAGNLQSVDGQTAAELPPPAASSAAVTPAATTAPARIHI